VSPRPADTTHGTAGRPADRASQMSDPGINWCPTICDMVNDGVINETGTAGDLEGECNPPEGYGRGRNMTNGVR
jgi:hypothetical protein